MDRLRWLFINLPNIPTLIAFRVLKREMKRDPQYVISWQANIAMAIYDESRPHCVCQYIEPEFDGHRPDCAVVRAYDAGTYEPLSGAFCNNAASRFMQLCFGVNVTTP